MSRRSLKPLPVEPSSGPGQTTMVMDPPGAVDGASVEGASDATGPAAAAPSESDQESQSLGRSWWTNVVDVVMAREDRAAASATDDDFAALPDIDSPDRLGRIEPARPVPPALSYAAPSDDDIYASPRPGYAAFVPPESRQAGVSRSSEASGPTQLSQDTSSGSVDFDERAETSAPMWMLIGVVAALVVVLLAGAAYALGQRSASPQQVPVPVTDTVTSVVTTPVTTTATATATVTAAPPPASTVTASASTVTQTQTATVTAPPPPASTVTQPPVTVTQTETQQVTAPGDVAP